MWGAPARTGGTPHAIRPYPARDRPHNRLAGRWHHRCTIAQAGIQLFEGSWSVKAFGNECPDASDPTPGPYCGNGASESDLYGAFGLPQGIQCNPVQPRCPLDSTPTDGFGNWAPLGGTRDGLNPLCAPWVNWQGYGTTQRPAKGGTAVSTGMKGGKIPPLYRNPAFFTSGGQPRTTSCASTSSDGYGGKGWVQAGNPVTGISLATTTATQKGGFRFFSAPAAGSWGIRTTGQLGEFAAIYPYVYRYTYATLRNNAGFFGPGYGPGNFTLTEKQGVPVAKIKVKQGAARFGGTMTMLGALTSKVCYYRDSGCSLGENDWHYDAIGTSALTSGGVVTHGYVVTDKAYYYHTALMATNTVSVEGSRFPWTTGSVTVTAAGRGPHKTVHYEQGYDNRFIYGALTMGTIRLVTPTLTRWLQPAANFETGGIGILKINFFGIEETYDLDGVANHLDNCSEVTNPGQDDSDGDGCGNLCDADYDNNGIVGFPDFGAFAAAFSSNDEEFCHFEPIPGCTVGFPDFGFFVAHFSVAPGPSGTTSGTTACP